MHDGVAAAACCLTSVGEGCAAAAAAAAASGTTWGESCVGRVACLGRAGSLTHSHAACCQSVLTSEGLSDQGPDAPGGTWVVVHVDVLCGASCICVLRRDTDAHSCLASIASRGIF
jgi:hypothetical protein